MSRARLAAAFLAGAVTATAVWAVAAPPSSPAPTSSAARARARYLALDTFAHALALIQSSYVDPVDERELLYDAIAGMASQLDLHSSFLRPHRYQRLQEDTEGEFGDVGLSLVEGAIDPSNPRRPPWPQVAEVAANSPAATAGVQAGDYLVAIDGAPTAELRNVLLGAAASQARLRGASGTRVTVAVLRVGWRRPRPLPLVRLQLKLATVKQRSDGEVGVLTISRFSESTAADARAALASLQRAGARALVLDLRGNPGGVVDQAIAVADLFLDRGTIVSVRERSRTERRAAHAGAVTQPLVALVDGGTASAAEIVAAALLDNGRATIAGEPTYGKGTVQTLFDLEEGAGLKVTTGRYYTPAGNQLESNGIQPHVKLMRNIPEGNVPRMSSSQTPGVRARNGATIAAGFDADPQLVAAVALARNSVRGSSRVEGRGPAEP
jgi:carboxyl-terminal processing protease